MPHPQCLCSLQSAASSEHKLKTASAAGRSVPSEGDQPLPRTAGVSRRPFHKLETAARSGGQARVENTPAFGDSESATMPNGG